MKPTLRSVCCALAAVLALHTSPALAEDAAELIRKGDVHYHRLEAAEALKYYRPAEELDPKNADLLVKISRQYRHLMSDAPNKAEKLRLGGMALGYAERAAALEPEDADSQLAVAITYGKILPYQGNRERVENSRRIKIAAEKAIRLEPNNDLAWHILGRWHVVLADVGPVQRSLARLIYGKLPPASNEDGAKCFEKAMALNPDRLMHYIELGRTYAQMGRKEEAARYIKKGLKMANTEKDDPETKAKGREILAKLE